MKLSKRTPAEKDARLVQQAYGNIRMVNPQITIEQVAERLRLKRERERMFINIYQDIAEIERSGKNVKCLNFLELKDILVKEYRVPSRMSENRYTAMVKSVILGNTIWEDRGDSK